MAVQNISHGIERIERFAQGKCQPGPRLENGKVSLDQRRQPVFVLAVGRMGFENQIRHC